MLVTTSCFWTLTFICNVLSSYFHIALLDLPHLILVYIFSLKFLFQHFVQNNQQWRTNVQFYFISKNFKGKKDANCEKKSCSNERVVATMHNHPLCRKRNYQLVDQKATKCKTFEWTRNQKKRLLKARHHQNIIRKEENIKIGSNHIFGHQF
jgi:hypothetical protein